MSFSSNVGNDALFLLGTVGKSEIWSTLTWDACCAVEMTVEGVFTEVAGGVDPLKFLLVEVPC